jgi:hypothetical protein
MLQAGDGFARLPATVIVPVAIGCRQLPEMPIILKRLRSTFRPQLKRLPNLDRMRDLLSGDTD